MGLIRIHKTETKRWIIPKRKGHFYRCTCGNHLAGYKLQEVCEGCGACKVACPAGAIFYNENGLAEVEHGKCLTCGYCSPVCPVRAIIMY